LDSPQDVTLGENRLARRQEYMGRSVKAITTKLVLPNNKKVGLVVAHPLCLFPRNLLVHYQATYNLRRLLRTDEFSKDTIIGGDFNEPSFMPRSFKNTTSKILNFKTGSIAQPTWRLNASHRTLIRANLDQLYWTKKGSLQLTGFEIIDSGISDHKPLLATFEV
jgi:endonuclease/exonuclease/phosphatase (EEP) superfamily protein YafD